MGRGSGSTLHGREGSEPELGISRLLISKLFPTTISSALSNERLCICAQKFRLRAGTSTSCGFFLSHHTHLYLTCLLGCQPGSFATIIYMGAVCSPCTTFLCSLSPGLGPWQRASDAQSCLSGSVAKRRNLPPVSLQVPASATVSIVVAAPVTSQPLLEVWTRAFQLRAFYVSGTLTIWLSLSCLALVRFLYHKKQFHIC